MYLIEILEENCRPDIIYDVRYVDIYICPFVARDNDGCPRGTFYP